MQVNIITHIKHSKVDKKIDKRGGNNKHLEEEF